MKVYKTQKDVEKDIVNNVLDCQNQDVKFENHINIDATIINAWDINAKNIDAWDINAKNINAKNIDAWDINAKNIDAGNINAKNINAWDINAKNINAKNINAVNIDAWDINAKNIGAMDINAMDINAWDIVYYAFCTSYNSIKCASWKSKREPAHDPICLDGELIIKDKKEIPEYSIEEAIEKMGHAFKIKK